MKSLMIAAAGAALTLAAAPAVSQAQAYGTIGYAGVDADGADLGAIQARLGYKFNPYIGVEGEAAFGVSDGSVGAVDVDLKHEFGAFVVGTAPVSDRFDLFARVGYSGAEFDTSLGDVSDDGFAYGVGGQFNFTQSDGVRLDWTHHDYDAGEADVWSIGYARKF